MDYRELEERFTDRLRLARRPVAIAFRDAPPAGVARFAGTAPSGCSFWRLAAAGRVFSTVPGDHHNCAVGSHTHAIPLPADRAAELEQTMTFMVGLGYLRVDEVPGIPRLPRAPGAVVYAPLADTPVEPDVVLFAGPPGRIMLLQEAAMHARVGTAAPLLGRPTCAALPVARSGSVAASTGCIGNRVYTELGDDELYIAVPARDAARLAESLDVIVAANATLRDYHRERRRALATP